MTSDFEYEDQAELATIMSEGLFLSVCEDLPMPMVDDTVRQAELQSRLHAHICFGSFGRPSRTIVF